MARPKRMKEEINVARKEKNERSNEGKIGLRMKTNRRKAH